MAGTNPAVVAVFARALSSGTHDTAAHSLTGRTRMLVLGLTPSALSIGSLAVRRLRRGGTYTKIHTNTARVGHTSSEVRVNLNMRCMWTVRVVSNAPIAKRCHLSTARADVAREERRMALTAWCHRGQGS